MRTRKQDQKRETKSIRRGEHNQNMKYNKKDRIRIG